MKVMRRVFGVILGYAIFAASAVLLFRLAGRDPHAQQDVVFMTGSIAHGMFFAAVGGYVSAAVGGGRARIQASWVGGIIAVGAALSLPAGPEAGAIWSRVGALALMSPSAVIGGIVRERKAVPAGPAEQA